MAIDLGNVTLDPPVLLAPLAGITDLPFRRLVASFGAGLVVSEMVASGEILTARPSVRAKARTDLGIADLGVRTSVQLAGREARAMGDAARAVADMGAGIIDINMGCPAKKVTGGLSGSALMRDPDHALRLIDAVVGAVDVPVTVKCRIGIDDQDSEAALSVFAQAVVNAGADVLIVHARKAWLKGLSPRENRDVPPLDYDRVYRLKQAFAGTPVVINGGILSLDEAEAHLAHVDGAMLGRAAYQNPWLLAEVDARLFDASSPLANRGEAVDAMRPHIEVELTKGQKLNRIVRHMIGLYQGVPGARAWRRILTVDSLKEGAGLEVLDAALAAVEGQGRAAA